MNQIKAFSPNSASDIARKFNKKGYDATITETHKVTTDGIGIVTTRIYTVASTQTDTKPQIIYIDPTGAQKPLEDLFN